MLVAHLDNHAGVLGEEELHDVIVGDVMEIDVHTAVGVGKGHLEQCGDETTGRDVVASHNPTAVDELLHCLETVSEVLGIGYGGHIVAYLAEALRKGGATQTLGVEAEVDMVEG